VVASNEIQTFEFAVTDLLPTTNDIRLIIESSSNAGDLFFDDIVIRKANLTFTDMSAHVNLFYNENRSTPQNISIPGSWLRVNGQQVSSQIEIQPAESVLLFKTNTPAPTHQLTILSNPVSGGVISGSGFYTAGTVLNLEAIPNTGFVFTFWDRSTGEPLGVSPELTYTTRAQNDTIKANFAAIEEISYEISNILRLSIIQTLEPLIVSGETIPIFDERVNPQSQIPDLLSGKSYVLIKSQQEVETTNDKTSFRQNALITLECVVKYPVNVGSKLSSELISLEIQSKITRQIIVPGWQVLAMTRVNATSIVEQGVTQTLYRKLITYSFDVYRRELS